MTERMGGHGTNFCEFLKGYIGARPDSPLNYHIREYCEAVIETSQFAWIGAFQVTDELDRERLHLYFMQKDPLPERMNTAEENRAISRWLGSKKTV